MKRTYWCLLACLVWSGCGSGGTYSLTIVLPEDAKDQTTRIRVAVLEPGPTATCEALVLRQAAPGETGYTIEDEISFDYPVTGTIEQLQELGPGQRLFYAEGNNTFGGMIVNGCTRIEAGGVGPQTVTIELDWVTVCIPTNDGIEICDGLDNDCDDGTDDLALADLCADLTGATATACSDGNCIYECYENWVNVNADWSDGCECHFTRDKVEWCDGLDNDCDGETDGSSCSTCSVNADCMDLGSCIEGQCSGGTCSVEYLSDGTACDDSDACTLLDSCDQGVCSGEAKDCADELDCTTDLCLADGSCSNELQNGYCLIDSVCYSTGETSADSSCRTCDPALASDQWQIKAAGESCDDGLWCTGTDTCSATGDCEHTNIPCPVPCLQNCSEIEQNCSEDPLGTACDDGFSCTQDATCDGAGNCVGIPIENYCAANEECQPACATDEFGCVARPHWIILNCPTTAPFDTPATCGFSLQNGEGSEACASCSVRLVPSIVSQTDFYQAGACTLGDWQFEDHSCINGPTWCPFTSGGETQACCSDVACSPGDEALDFLPSQCTENGWRLSQLFSLDSFEKLRACYKIMQRSPSVEGSLQLMADRNDGSDPLVVTCDEPDAWHDSFPTETCVDLPLSVGDWPSTRLTYWVELGQQDSEILLGKTSLYGFPPECNQEQVAFNTSFDGCGQAVASHDGWTFGPVGTCAEGAECGFTGGLLVDNTVSPVNASRDLDMPDLRPPARLCWSHYHTAGFVGEYNFSLSGGSGKVWYVQIYRSRFPAFALNPVCRDFCIDLSEFGGSIFGSGNAQLNLSAQATSGTLLINDVRIDASIECDASGLLEAGPVEPDGQGGFQVQVNNLQGLPRRALLECTWGEGAVYATREIEFVTP
jgi:hypothetical protein